MRAHGAAPFPLEVAGEGRFFLDLSNDRMNTVTPGSTRGRWRSMQRGSFTANDAGSSPA
jgi:hypothetical protein